MLGSARTTVLPKKQAPAHARAPKVGARLLAAKRDDCLEIIEADNCRRHYLRWLPMAKKSVSVTHL